MKISGLLLLLLIHLVNAKDLIMPDILIVIAGLTESSETNNKKNDAVSRASQSINNKLKAHTTSEIAVQMGVFLKEKSYNADIISADGSKRDLTKYELIIIGSGIYGMAPHGSIKQFILANEKILKEKKVALFAVCGSLCTDSEPNKQKALKLVDKMAFSLTPVSKTVLRGKVKDNGSFLNWIGTKIFKTYPPGDYREWDVIEKWTISLIGNGS